MNNYFYFAVIRFEETVMAGTTRTKRVPVTHFGKNAYATPMDCIKANETWMASHIGERFSVCGFPKKLKLDEHGISHGYVEEPEQLPA